MEAMMGTGARRTSASGVLPPRIGAMGTEIPRRVTVPLTTIATHITAGCVVRTPDTENVPSASVWLDWLWHVTAAPPTGVLSCRTTRPVTIVNGSGMMLTT